MAPMTGTRRRFYTPYEVAKHNTADDCWISFLGGVYDLTPLLQVGLLRMHVCRAGCLEA
jgi:hypothetical protein